MRPQESSIPPFPQRLLIYGLTIILAVAGAVAAVRWLGLRGEEALMVEGAVLFLIAGSARAPRLFAAVRQDGAFSWTSSERIVRSILIVIALFILFGVYLLRRL
jgi:hypothetical protein